MKNLKPVVLGAGAFLYSLLSISIALADDTEIYVPKDLPADQYVRPNILFVLDSSGSMSSAVAGSGGLNRNQVLKNVVNNLIDEIKVKEDVNVGFMRFRGTSSEEGGRVLSPVQRLTNANAASMQAIVNNIPTADWTPLSETFDEAYRYMAGLAPVYGGASSVASSISGGKYISPISHSCQKSHIIYVTDGEPTRDQSSNDSIRNLVTGKNTLYPAATCGAGHGVCLPHLAEFMANQDMMPTPTFDDPTGRKQTVTSHFVGFAVNLPILQNSARAGGGSYYTSNNVSGLTDALKAIIVDITADNTSFAAPSVAVSAFNNLGYRNALYYALFRPAEGTNWPGNVKRYKLSEDTNGNPLIVDKNGDAAIDDTTGFFSNNASSFWSDFDGSDVAKGGVAGQLGSRNTSKLFTWTAADRAPTSSTAALEILADSNSGITQSMLGANTAAERTTYINWARGKNTDGTDRLAVGDVLHNEPRLIAYTTDENLVRASNSALPRPGDKDYNPDAIPKYDPAIGPSPEQLYMFFGSNEGYIHAINPVDGKEKFAFLPKELLSNPGAYFRDAKGSNNKRYGIDGLINVWTKYGDISANKTRSITQAYLYAGMRRGGSNYYSLDVTNIDSPALKWVIKGPQQTAQSNGTVVNATTNITTGYEKLGLTYSAARLADIKVAGATTKVLIFSGGYDLDQDFVGTNLPKTDDLGNSLFIADANTGELLWSASNSGADLDIAEMNHSIPASPTIIDINRDGLADIIYIADLGGQVFRFDINNGNSGASNLATGGRIANLGGTTTANNRRFFTSPDVAFIQERGGKPYFTVSLGSGFREAPLNTDTTDRFYVLRDTAVYAKPSSYETITESDLVDVSGVNLTTTQSKEVQDDIDLLENQMKVLNTNLSTAQENFVSYKAGIGYTAKVDGSISAYDAANDKQRQIDELTLLNGPYLAAHAPESRQQSQLQDALMRARDTLAAIEQARANAQTLADSTNAATLAAAASSAATALTAAQNAYTTAQGLAASNAATAASKDATALASEIVAAAAVNDYNSAVADKATADSELATANTNAATALTAKNTANTVLAAANTTAANALTAKTAADSAYSSASTTAATALSTQSAAITALTLSENTASIALTTKNDADAALSTANTAAANALTTRNNAVTTLNAANADVVTKQGTVTTTTSNLATATASALSAQGTFDTADTALVAASSNVTTKQDARDAANSVLTAAQADLDADILANGSPGAPALVTARNAAQTAVNSANTALTAANTDAAAKLATRNSAATTLATANTNVTSKQAAKDAADAALLSSNTAAVAALATKNTADADLATANATVTTAQTAKTAADSALGAANADAASKLATKNAADTALASANTNAATKFAAKTAADNVLGTANASAGIALTEKNNADTALTAANAQVSAKQTAQTTAASNLTAATNTRNSTAATATADRAASNSAAATAAASASNAASKLTAQNAATSAKAAADLAASNAVADDIAVAALTVQNNRMAANYETLIALQGSLDNAYAGIITQENAIIAAKADPGFPSDQIPAMETDLTNARSDYAALADFAQRTALNTGSPTAAVSLLSDVNAALSAGNAAAIAAALNTALGALEGSLGAPDPLVGPLAQLLTRDEVSKNNALQSKADSEQGAVNLIGSLTLERNALTTQAVTLKAEAEALEVTLYVAASNLLSGPQLSAANASGNYTNPLTTFDAYQYLIDLALAAANDPVTGLPALRKQINDKYALLTPGDTYTANADLLAAAKGFYVRLVKGEKVLSNSVSFRKAVLFSTFTPRGQAVSTCGADVGRGKTYAFSLIDASAVFAVSANGVVTPTRSFDLKRSGIPPTPSVILTDNKPVFLTGTETLNEQDPTSGIPGELVCTQGNETLCESGPTKSTYWRED